MPPLKRFSLTVMAMIAFAANSILCRLALEGGLIDPGSFTSLRLISGALLLWLLLLVRKSPVSPRKADPRAAFSLFAYALCFSYAYVDLGAGTGALILFGCVQLTTISVGIVQGERPAMMVWLGILLASGGLAFLLLPGLRAPPLDSAMLMGIAGIAWGLYSLRGKLATDAITATAHNFILTVPLALIVSLTLLPTIYLTTAGALLAVASGTLASACGYVIWYSALPALKSSVAATAQLSVPIIAAVGGVIFISEPVTTRLIIASIAVLGGIWLVIKK